ncbi:YbfB/YjiJ family MFS transporter [Extensimonas vulgaris]|uniref:Putative MFS family arabinose efflux permease n=1 Tax=Extensimonas vulgaris TaxID=1031594 RepID=A0A369AI64_9BURK|nr:YbfB/YjiJ family MFS transporter [Extensimonas vulgaris]RCX07847.1 putative MFS family arabinose efflux permease [Extensimonas vulgaris]TWI35581.1 putative MFS family arabinose efflux permease [Extensimonas vulgaris]TXD13262.1 YbfB/YjiJ family MFS transporter [Extensimonas vulgaris]
MRSAPSPAPNEAPPNAAPAESTAQRPMDIALAGLVALAVAMGIGRFAFTPLLPMMLHDGLLDLPGASWLASANYFGYLVGAVLCTLQPWLWARLRVLPLFAFVTLVRGGLVATGLLTLAMAWPAPAAWPVLRFAAGVTSAVVFVYTSGWCMARLARLGVPALSGMIYMGPGAGIVLSGLAASAMTAWHWRAAAGWGLFGLLAWVLAALVWRTLRGSDERLHAGAPAAGQTGSGASAPPQGRAEMAWLALAYGLAGFGYIITATFLPVIARTALPGSAWLDMFWPIFGLGVMGGALLVSRLPHGGDFRLRLIVCYVLQAAGVVASLYSPSLGGFVLGSVLLGLPFTAITFFAMHEVRRLRPAQAASFIGLLTAVYGVGQILGPALVALLLRRLPDAAAGFTLSLEVAAGALLAGALIYAGMVWAYPLKAAAVSGGAQA